jgi:hypothetical protein
MVKASILKGALRVKARRVLLLSNLIVPSLLLFFCLRILSSGNQTGEQNWENGSNLKLSFTKYPFLSL